MKYELWIDGIWQDTFSSEVAVGFAITAWLVRHANTVKAEYGNVNFQVKIV